MKFLGKKKGFTLIEMLIVIVIIGVLASALIPRLGSARWKANDVARKADLQQLATAIISYQIDQNAFPSGKAQILSSGTMATNLIKGGMASIPVGDATVYSGLDWASSSGYIYYPMKKNGGNNNGFVLMARTETEWGSNFVLCSAIITSTNATNGDFDVDNVKVCSSVSLWASCDANACTALDKSQLRYIYKY